jgi:hypothetical protein
MLGKIMKALRSALRSMMRLLDGTWRYVFGAGGGDIVVDDYEPVVEKTLENAVNAPAPEEHDLRTDLRRDAALVRIYAMKSVMTGERPASASCLPRIVREWLPGLDAGQLKMLAEANADQVLQHIHQGPYLQGVLRVQRLQPVPLEMQTGPGVDDGGPREIAEVRPAFG